MNDLHHQIGKLEGRLDSLEKTNNSDITRIEARIDKIEKRFDDVDKKLDGIADSVKEQRAKIDISYSVIAKIIAVASGASGFIMWVIDKIK